MSAAVRPPRWRKALHAAATIIGGPVWLNAYASALLVKACAHIARWASPDDPGAGNCWEYALTRLEPGDVLRVVRLDDARLLKVLPVLHCQIERADGTIEQTIPRKRVRQLWLPWRAFYHRRKVVRS